MTSMSDGEQEFIDCANCTLLVHRRIHVKCCECPSSFCIQCFRMGCETGAHRRGHNYEIRDPVGEPTFEGKGSWGCIEEARLLVAAHRYKLGNWGEMINMMESDRQAHQAQEYFDRCFIRGPFGQFALKGISWVDTKRSMVADGSIDQLLRSDSDRIQRMLLIMDALRSSQEIFNPEDPDLDHIINNVVERHIEEFKANIRDKPTPSGQIDDKQNTEEMLSDDSNDLSDDVDACGRNKAPDDAEMTGLEPENDSDDEDSPTIPIVVLQKVKDKGKVEMKSEIRDKKTLRKPLIISHAIIRSSKGNRSSQRKSVQESIKKTRYQRVQQESSSSDDDLEGYTEESDKADTEQLSVNDGEEPTHGLEDSAVGCEDDTSSESEVVSNKASVGKLATHCPVPIIVRKKRRAKIISKKQRRLKEFQKRMARNTKARERRLHELTELCPRQMISELRVSAPRLALDREKNITERPKLRQDDLNMLAYNVDRDDFELEWFNDAEHLISRLHIHRSVDRMGDIDNDIKFARVQKYLRILKARKAKRRAIIEHDKITEFFNFMMNMTLEKRKASEIMADRSAMEKLLTRAQQTLTREELDDLNMNIEKADQLIERISRLKELQRNGITSLKEDDWLVTVMNFWNRTRILFYSSIRLFCFIYFVVCYLSTAIFMLLSKKARCHRNKKRIYRPGIADAIVINARELSEIDVFYNEVGYSTAHNYRFQFFLPQSYKGVAILQEQVQYWGAMNSGNQNSQWGSLERFEDSPNINSYMGNSSVAAFDFGDLYHEDFNLGSDFNDAPSLDDINVTPMDDLPRRKEKNYIGWENNAAFPSDFDIQSGNSTQNISMDHQHSVQFGPSHNELSECASSSGRSEQEYINNYVVGNVYRDSEYSANNFHNTNPFNNFADIPNFQEDSNVRRYSGSTTIKIQEQQGFEHQFFTSFNQHQFETSRFNQNVQESNVEANISNESIVRERHSIDNQINMAQSSTQSIGNFRNPPQQSEIVPYESVGNFNTDQLTGYSNPLALSVHDKDMHYEQERLYNQQISRTETDNQRYFANQCMPLWDKDNLSDNVFNHLPSSIQQTEYHQKVRVREENLQHHQTMPVIKIMDQIVKGGNTTNMPRSSYISPYQQDLTSNEIIEIVDEGVVQLNSNSNEAKFCTSNTLRLNRDEKYRELLFQEQEMKRLQKIEKHPLIEEKQQYGNQHFQGEKQNIQIGSQPHLGIGQQQHIQFEQYFQTKQRRHTHTGQQNLQAVHQPHLQIGHQLGPVERQHNSQMEVQKYLQMGFQDHLPVRQYHSQMEQQQRFQVGQESHPSHLVQQNSQTQQKQQNLGHKPEVKRLHLYHSKPLLNQVVQDSQQGQEEIGGNKHFPQVEQLVQPQTNFVVQGFQVGQQYEDIEQQRLNEQGYQIEQKQTSNAYQQINKLEVKRDQAISQLCFPQNTMQQQFLYQQSDNQKINASMHYENTKPEHSDTVYQDSINQKSSQYDQNRFLSPQDLNFGLTPYISDDIVYDKNSYNRSNFSAPYNKPENEQYHKYENPSIKELLVAPIKQSISQNVYSHQYPKMKSTDNLIGETNNIHPHESIKMSLSNQEKEQENASCVNFQMGPLLDELPTSSIYIASPISSSELSIIRPTGDKDFKVIAPNNSSQYISDFSIPRTLGSENTFGHSLDQQPISVQDTIKEDGLKSSSQSKPTIKSTTWDAPDNSCDKSIELASTVINSRPSSAVSDLFKELNFPSDCGDFCEWFLAENLNSLGDENTLEPFESLGSSSVMSRLEDLSFIDADTTKEKFAFKRGRGRPRKNITDSKSLKKSSEKLSGCLVSDNRQRSRKPPFLSVSMDEIKNNEHSIIPESKSRSRPRDRSHREKKTRSTERERLLDIAKRQPDDFSFPIGETEPLTLYDRAKTNQRGAARQANERLKASRNREIEESGSGYLKPPSVCEKKTSPLKKTMKISPKGIDKVKKSIASRQRGDVVECDAFEIKKVKSKDGRIKHNTIEEVEVATDKHFYKEPNKASVCYTWKDRNYENRFLLISRIPYLKKTKGKEKSDVQVGLIIPELHEAEHEIIGPETHGSFKGAFDILDTSNDKTTGVIFPSNQIPFSETQEVTTSYDDNTGWSLAGLDLETLEELREWMLFDFPPPMLHVPDVPVMSPVQEEVQERHVTQQDIIAMELKDIPWPKAEKYTTGKTFDGFQNWFPKKVKVTQHDYLDLPILFEAPIPREVFYAQYLRALDETYMNKITEKKSRHMLISWPKADVKTYSFTCDLSSKCPLICGHSLPYLDPCNQILSCKPNFKKPDPLEDYYFRVLKERNERENIASKIIESLIDRVLFLEDWPVIPKHQFSVLYHGRLEENVIHHVPEILPAYLDIHTKHSKIDEIYNIDFILQRDNVSEATQIIYIELQKQYCREQLFISENSAHFELIMEAISCEKVIPIPRKDNSSLVLSNITFEKVHQSEYCSVSTTADIASTENCFLSVYTVNSILNGSLNVNSFIERTFAQPRVEMSSLNVCDVFANMQRNQSTEDVTFVNVLRNLEFFSCCMTNVNISFINKKETIGEIENCLPVKVSEKCSLHIFTLHIMRKKQMEVKDYSVVKRIALEDSAFLSICSKVFNISENESSIRRNKGYEFICPIARRKTVSFHIATISFSRKRKMERADATVSKKLAIEDKAGFIVAVMSNKDKSNYGEVTIMKDPRLPIKVSHNIKEVEKKWIQLAKHCHVHEIASSVDVMSFAIHLKNHFNNSMKIDCTLTMKDVSDFVIYQTRKLSSQFHDDILTEIGIKLDLGLLCNLHIWDGIVKKSRAKTAKYGVDRELLAEKFVFLGPSYLPLFGRPWRRWLPSLTYQNTSTLANTLAICCRQITLGGRDDLSCSLQACKLWWVFMMCRNVVPWSVYPALTRRQLFMFVRLLEVLSDIKQPAFCFYPPRQFFEAVSLMMDHPKIRTIPKDVYHPDVTTFASLKKKECRVFDIGYSLPDILCYWMDDMDRLDGYLNRDICIAHFNSNMFLSQTEWVRINYGRNIQHLLPSYSEVQIMEKLEYCLADNDISLKLRKEISLLKSALEIDLKIDKFSTDIMPFDLLDPFALSPVFIDHLPISEQFRKDFHYTISQVLTNKSQLPHQLLLKRNTANLLKWNRRTNERPDLDGKRISGGRNVSGKITMIDRICNEFWIKPIKNMSITCTNQLGEGMAPLITQCTPSNNLEHSQNSSTTYNACKIFEAHKTKMVTSSSNSKTQEVYKDFPSTPSTSSNNRVLDMRQNFNIESVLKPCPLIICKSDDKLQDKGQCNSTESESCISKQHADAVSFQAMKKLSSSVKRSKIQLLNKLKRLRSKDEDLSEDSDAPLIRKTRMFKVSEQSRASLRHTKVRSAVQTEKNLHEAVNVAHSLSIAKLEGKCFSVLPSVDRHRIRQRYKRRLPLSNKSSERIDAADTKRYRGQYLLDLSNFNSAIRMCLRRPRPFLGLFKMMKHQFRVLAKRRWVEIHKRKYDKEIFEKFLRTEDISEVKMFEKINLLKAEQDMEQVLGITRAEAKEMEISALRDSKTPVFNSCCLQVVGDWDNRCMDATNSVALHHSSGLILEPAYAYMTQMMWGYEQREKTCSYYDLKANQIRIPAELSDSEDDCYRPGDFSPFSTDDEWNKFYEKERRKKVKKFQDHYVPDS